jgi:hypothetical protein
MGELIRKSELAKRAGVTPGAVTRALKRNGLKRALVGKLVDSGHPEAVKYIQEGRRKNELGKKQGGGVKEAPPRIAHISPTNEQIEESLSMLPEDIRELQDLSLRDLLGMFGTVGEMGDFLKATKTMEDIQASKLKNADTEGHLVSRDLVQRGVLNQLDNMLKRLLTDGSRTIAKQVHTMALAQRSVEDCEAFVNERLSSFSRSTKARMVKALREG